MQSLTEIKLKILGLEAERRAIKIRASEIEDSLSVLKKELDTRLDHFLDETVSDLINVDGKYTGAGDQRSVVNDAILDIITGPNRLRIEKMCTKNYDSWSSQRSDCKYGYSPRHGTINFSIGLVERDHEFTDTEKEACVHYLEMLCKSMAK